jgi:DnaK suppressor protein
MKEKLEIGRPGSAKNVIMALPGGVNKAVGKRGSHGRDDSRSKFLNNLLLRKQDVEESLQQLFHSQKQQEGPLFADEFIEEADHAEREISAQKHYSLLERKNRELEKVEFLIRKVLQDEDFGLCEECGQRIPEARLLIVPDATRCVPCQREMEKLDSRRSSTERAYLSSGRKKELQWEDKGESNSVQRLTIKTDFEHLSFMDMEEMEIEQNQSEEDEGQ